MPLHPSFLRLLYPHLYSRPVSAPPRPTSAPASRRKRSRRFARRSTCSTPMAAAPLTPRSSRLPCSRWASKPRTKPSTRYAVEILIERRIFAFPFVHPMRSLVYYFLPTSYCLDCASFPNTEKERIEDRALNPLVNLHVYLCIFTIDDWRH